MPDALEQIPLADPEFDPTTIPFVAKIVSGEIPGVLITENDINNPEAAPLRENGRSLFTKAGLVLSPTSKGAVIYNPDVIKLSEIKALDKAGDLESVVPPLSTVTTSDSATGGPGAVQSESGGESSPRPAIPFGQTLPPPMPASAQRPVNVARVRGATAGARPPATQASPTGGALLARIRQPVV